MSYFQKLEYEDVERASICAEDRCARDEFFDRDVHYCQVEGRDNFDYAYEGYCAEIAVSKYLRIPWRNDFENRALGDVGPYEVKSTPYKTGKLVIQARHPDERVYIHTRTALLIHPNHMIEIVGWAWGHEVKGKGKLQGVVPAYFLPNHFIRPIKTLPQCV